jgi:hypothetical protein
MAGQPITIYGMYGIENDRGTRDDESNHSISDQLVMHPVTDKPGLYKTFGLTDDVAVKIQNIPIGNVIMFVQSGQFGRSVSEESVLFFMKVRKTAKGRGLFIQLNRVPTELAYENVKLSFPELKKTFKLDTGTVEKESKIPRCDYKVMGMPADQINKLVDDYTTLTNAYTGIIKGTRNLNIVDITKPGEIDEAVKHIDGINRLKEILKYDNPKQFADRLEEIFKSSDITEVNTEKAVLEKSRSYKKPLLIVLSLIAGGVAFDVALRYYTGEGLIDNFLTGVKQLTDLIGITQSIENGRSDTSRVKDVRKQIRDRLGSI